MSELHKQKWDESWVECVRNCAEEKWSRIEEGREIDLANSNCLLCKKVDNICIICPVYFKSGITGCTNTPYIDWLNYFQNHPFYQGPRRVIDQKSKELARAEKEFLLALADEMEEVSKKGKYFLKIRNPETAIGEDEIYINIVNKSGRKIMRGSLATLDKGRRLRLHSMVNAEAVKVDHCGGRVATVDY